MTKLISEIVGSILNFIPKDKIKNVFVSERLIIPYIQFGYLSNRFLCSLNNQELKEVNKNWNWNRQSTFLYACKNGHTSVVELLLKDHRVNPADQNNEAIRSASMNGHYGVTDLLLKDKRVDPTANNNEAIKRSSWRGSTKVVKSLLNWSSSDSKRVDPTDNNNYAIMTAIENEHYGVVELLLKDSRVDPTINNNEAIILASMYGRTSVVELLLNWRGPLDSKGSPTRVDPTDQNNEALILASKYRRTSVVELLLKDSRVVETRIQEARDGK